MPVLTTNQIKEGYFAQIGGFPPAKIVNELCEYQGETHLCIACTQLDGEKVKLLFPNMKWYSDKDKQRILKEWIDFLQTNTTAFTALHFNSHVPQKLFDATCYQKNLVELRFKWGSYTDLTALRNLKKLKFLFIGSGARVRKLGVIPELKNLIVLSLQNFKHIEDYSPLTALYNLEQLIISGPVLDTTPVRDLEFLRDMKSLSSVWTPNIRILKSYSNGEWLNFCASLSNLYDIHDCLQGRN